METTTIACPVGFTDPNVDPATSPIWIDAAGNRYAVASGLLEGYVTTEHTTATPSGVTIIVGVDGLTALGMMGLCPDVA